MTKTFTVCAVTWAAGVFLVLFSAFFVQRRVKQTLMQGKEIGEDILESGTTSVPVRFGFFHKIHVVPAGMHARIAFIICNIYRHILLKMQKGSWLSVSQRSIGLIRSCGFTIFFGIMMKNILQDEKAVHKKPSAECREYAQGLLNIQKESKKLHLSLLRSVREM